MQTFQRKTAKRIAAVTLLMAACASPLAWLVSRENAEQEVVAFAQEESRRVLSAHRSVRLDGPQAATQAQQAAQLLTGGLFEIAEIYGPDGHKLAESVTPEGHVNYPDLKVGAWKAKALQVRVDQTQRPGCLNPGFIAE
jgi:hypothetical protein